MDRSIQITLGASNHALEERETNDYYATEPKATKMLLEKEVFNKNIKDFCSFASTEDNEDAGFDSDYKGVHCEDCAWYDGYLEECVVQNDNGYCGLLDPQPWDYCSRAESR